MSSTIGESSGTPDIHEGIIDEEPVATFAHHTEVLFVADHPFDALVGELAAYFVVDFVGLVVLEQLDAFKHGLAEGKAVGLWRGDAEVGLGNGGLGHLLQEHALELWAYLLLLGRHLYYIMWIFIDWANYQSLLTGGCLSSNSIS